MICDCIFRICDPFFKTTFRICTFINCIRRCCASCFVKSSFFYFVYGVFPGSILSQITMVMSRTGNNNIDCFFKRIKIYISCCLDLKCKTSGFQSSYCINFIFCLSNPDDLFSGRCYGDLTCQISKIQIFCLIFFQGNIFLFQLLVSLNDLEFLDDLSLITSGTCNDHLGCTRFFVVSVGNIVSDLFIIVFLYDFPDIWLNGTSVCLKRY